VHQFLRYAKFVIEELGAFPDYWVTMNEPMVAAILGNVLASFHRSDVRSGVPRRIQIYLRAMRSLH